MPPPNLTPRFGISCGVCVVCLNLESGHSSLQAYSRKRFTIAASPASIPPLHQLTRAAPVMRAMIGRWYHGPIPRAESERLLAGQAVGAFLVRSSESRPGLTLSVRCVSRRVCATMPGRCSY